MVGDGMMVMGCMYVCLYVFMYVCMHVCMYDFVLYECMHVCLYIAFLFIFPYFHSSVTVVVEMMPKSVQECRIHSQDEIYDVRQLIKPSISKRYQYLELGFNRVF